MQQTVLPLPVIPEDSYALSVKHSFKIPAFRLYNAWTEQFDTWFARPGSVLMTPSVDRPFFFETEYKFEEGRPSERHPHYGRFLRLDPNKLVEMAWVTGKGGTEGRETVLTITLREENGTTALGLNHAGFATPTARDGHAVTWPIVLARLEEVLAKTA